MYTKKVVVEFIGSAEKALSKARFAITSAHGHADPTRNAELQHSLQTAMEELEKGLNKLADVANFLGAISAAVDQHYPSDEKDGVTV